MHGDWIPEGCGSGDSESTLLRKGTIFSSLRRALSIVTMYYLVRVVAAANRPKPTPDWFRDADVDLYKERGEGQERG